MGNSWYVLAAIWLLLVEVTLGSSRYRDDGKCGVSNPAPDGLAADCEFIPPFPTCCQSNEHCGWHCDEGTYVSHYISVIHYQCLICLILTSILFHFTNFSLILVPKMLTNSIGRQFLGIRFHFTIFFMDFQKTNENLFSCWLLVKMNIIVEYKLLKILITYHYYTFRSIQNMYNSLGVARVNFDGCVLFGSRCSTDQ